MVLITAYGPTGPWKLGKTDFGLFLAENLLRLNMVSEVATNIDTSVGSSTYLTWFLSVIGYIQAAGLNSTFWMSYRNMHIVEGP